MTCKNCTIDFDSKYCPNCGQSANIHRITPGHVVHDLLHAFTHADKGFLLLMKALILKPGYVAKEYIQGKRKTYFNPLSFLVITSALFAFIAYQTGYMDSLTGAKSARQISLHWQETIKIASTTGKWLILFLIAPLFAFVSWIFFIRKKFNYAEHFILNAYILGQATAFRLLIIIPLWMIPGVPFTVTYYFYEAVFIVYLIVAFKQFFGQNLFIVILKALLVRVLSVILFWSLIYGFVVVKNLIF